MKIPQTLKVKVVRPFTYAGKPVTAGTELELPYAFGREMAAAHKVSMLDWPPKSGPDIKDVSILGAPGAETVKEAANVKKQDAGRSTADKAVIKDESDAEKRANK
jgi:hypothetical protein